MKRNLVGSMVALVAALLLFAPSASAAAPAPPALPLEITGTAANGANFDGTFTLQRFANRGGELVAIGTLTGALGGQDITPQTVALPVKITQPTGSWRS